MYCTILCRDCRKVAQINLDNLVTACGLQSRQSIVQYRHAPKELHTLGMESQSGQYRCAARSHQQVGGRSGRVEVCRDDSAGTRPTGRELGRERCILRYPALQQINFTPCAAVTTRSSTIHPWQLAPLTSITQTYPAHARASTNT